jgi:ABC-type taurine transport system substrate-binding protein
MAESASVNVRSMNGKTIVRAPASGDLLNGSTGVTPMSSKVSVPLNV